MGVIHADEIAYIFGEPLNQTWSYRQDEQMFSRRIMRYWANFARMGNPSLNPDGNWEKTYWPAHTAFGKEFLILDVNSTQVGYGHRAKHCAFWKNFLPNLIALSGEPQTLVFFSLFFLFFFSFFVFLTFFRGALSFCLFPLHKKNIWQAGTKSKTTAPR